MIEYDQTISKSRNFSYSAADGISGLIWTNQHWLFQAVGSSKKILQDFLTAANLAKLQ